MTQHHKVLVTGASGFIAYHIIDVLLQHGYTVVGTVRNEEKAKNLLESFKDKPFEVAYVKDIMEPHAFDKVFQSDPSITAVVHSASPLKGSTPDEVINSAIEGTRSILTAIKTYGPQVSHVVITSSLSAAADTTRLFDPTHEINEDSWNPITLEAGQKAPYFASKKLAEKEFWRFVKEEDVKFKATAVIPPYVFGPIKHITSAEISGSNSLLLNPIFKEQGPDHKFNLPIYPFTDVRDTALAHVLPLGNPEKFDGQRLIPMAGIISAQTALDILHKRIPELKGKIPVGQPGTGTDFYYKSFKWDDTKSKELLGFEYVSTEDTVADMVQSYLDLSK